MREYGRLTRTDESEETAHQEVFWARGPVRLTEEESWLTRLCELRNAIVHGDDLNDELWHYEGQHQLNHIHDRLVNALRLVVAVAVDDPPLSRPPGDRSFARAAQEYLASSDEQASP